MIDLTTAPTVLHKRDYNGKVRTKLARWADTPNAEGKTLTFELTVSHDSDRKCFRVYATRSLASTDNGFTVNEYQPFRDIQRLDSVPVARFSAKALDATFADALANLRAESVAHLLVAA